MGKKRSSDLVVTAQQEERGYEGRGAEGNRANGLSTPLSPARNLRDASEQSELLASHACSSRVGVFLGNAELLGPLTRLGLANQVGSFPRLACRVVSVQALQSQRQLTTDSSHDRRKMKQKYSIWCSMEAID